MNKDFDISRYVSDGWKLYQRNVGGLAIATLAFFMLQLVAGFVPILGTLVSLAVSGPLMGGFYILIFDTVDDRPFEMRRLFDGFEQFLPLFLVYLLTTIFAALSIFVGIIPVAILGFVAVKVLAIDLSGGDPPFLLMMLLMIIVIIPPLVVSSWYLFAYAHTVRTKTDFWESMEFSRQIAMKYPGKVIAFMLVVGLVAASCVLTLGLAIFFTFPLSLCIVTIAYMDLVGDVAPARGREEEPPHHNPLAHSQPIPSSPPPIPSQSLSDSETYRAGDTIHCFVLVEQLDADEDTLTKIVRKGVPEAFNNQPVPPKITGQGLPLWPQGSDDLTDTVRQTIREQIHSHPELPDYTDSSRFRLSVWKGRDKHSGKNMAVVSVTTI